MKTRNNHNRGFGFGSGRVEVPGLAPLALAKRAVVNRRPLPVTEARMEVHAAIQWSLLDPRDPMGHDFLQTATGTQPVVRIDNLRLSVSTVQRVTAPDGHGGMIGRLPVWWMHTFQTVALPGGKIGLGAGKDSKAYDLAKAERFCHACVTNVDGVETDGTPKRAMVRLGVKAGGRYHSMKCPQCGHVHPYLESAAFPAQNMRLSAKNPRETDKWVLDTHSPVADIGMRFREVYPRVTGEQVSRKFPLPGAKDELLAIVTGRQELFPLSRVKPEQVRAVYIPMGAIKLDAVYMIAASPNRVGADGETWTFDLNRLLPAQQELGRWMIDLDMARSEGYLELRDKSRAVVVEAAAATRTGRALGSAEVLVEEIADVTKVEATPVVVTAPPVTAEVAPEAPKVEAPKAEVPRTVVLKSLDALSLVAPVEQPQASEPAAPVEQPQASEPVAPAKAEKPKAAKKGGRKPKAKAAPAPVPAGEPVVAEQQPSVDVGTPPAVTTPAEPAAIG